MGAQRRDLGDYSAKIEEYLRDPTIIHTKAGLALKLGITREYIADFKRQNQKWKGDFMKVWNSACRRILDSHLQRVLKDDNRLWEYLKFAFKNEMLEWSDTPNENMTSANINIVIPNPRKTTDEDE